MAPAHIGVVGGGLVGGMAALELSRLGFEVTLFENKAPNVAKSALGIDIRNFALSPASQRMLECAGAWCDASAAPFRAMTVWEDWGISEISFRAADVGREELGWIVETSPLLVTLWQKLEASSVGLVLGPVERIDVTPDGVAIGDGLRVDLVIGADGANSLVRRALQVPVIERGVGQSALATVVRTERDHGYTAWQRFLHDGPLAFLPSLDTHVCSVVWSQPPELAEERVGLSEADFCLAITRASEARLGKILEVDRRVVFPLTQQRVKSCAPHARVLLIGDAMRVIHPLAGLGVNLGLEDVRELVKAASQASDVTDPHAWRKFARMRQARSELMIQAMATLKRTYSSPSPVLGWLRNIGVQAVNQQSWIKRPIMREALGLTE